MKKNPKITKYLKLFFFRNKNTEKHSPTQRGKIRSSDFGLGRPSHPRGAKSWGQNPGFGFWTRKTPLTNGGQNLTWGKILGAKAGLRILDSENPLTHGGQNLGSKISHGAKYWEQKPGYGFWTRKTHSPMGAKSWEQNPGYGFWTRKTPLTHEGQNLGSKIRATDFGLGKPHSPTGGKILGGKISHGAKYWEQKPGYGFWTRKTHSPTGGKILGAKSGLRILDSEDLLTHGGQNLGGKISHGAKYWEQKPGYGFWTRKTHSPTGGKILGARAGLRILDSENPTHPRWAKSWKQNPGNGFWTRKTLTHGQNLGSKVRATDFGLGKPTHPRGGQNPGGKIRATDFGLGKPTLKRKCCSGKVRKSSKVRGQHQLNIFSIEENPRVLCQH